MPLTNAEKQRAYRKRKLEREGDDYRRAELDRVMKYYVTATECPRKCLKQRNEANKLRNRLSRLKKRAQQQNEAAPQMVSDDSGYATRGTNVDETETPDRLVVRLPFSVQPQPSTSSNGDFTPPTSSAKANGPKKARKRVLARINKQVKSLEDEVDRLKKKLKVKSSQLSRVKRKIDNQIRSGGKLTPKRQTERDLLQLGASPRRASTVRRKLLLGNVLTAEIAATREGNTLKKRQGLHRLMAGKLLQKYRCLKSVSQRTGLSRNAIQRNKIIAGRKSAVFEFKLESRLGKALRYQSAVSSFLEREDNCRVQPGKNDSVKVGGVKQQAVVLTDYMKNLHLKFLSENPTSSLSFASFCRMRPKHVKMTAFISRNACLCVKHENMAFKLQALRQCGVQIAQNPEAIIPYSETIDDLLLAIGDNEVTYKQWAKVKLEDGKDKMMLKKTTCTADEYKRVVKSETAEFVAHVDRLTSQYRQIRELKKNLAADEVIVQMDFAENFSCRQADEVQSSYWNQTQVTLHPAVIYFKDDDGSDLQHKSFVVVSDTVSHRASTVAAFIDAIMVEVKKLKPDVKCVHYWTDSPSSQYRNRFIFYIIATHAQRYNVQARWNYFESGHGKGPCDGVGGCAKRMADEAIRRGIVIQNANDFFLWALKGMKTVGFIFVPKRACEEKQEELDNLGKREIKSVSGTMKLHVVGYEALSGQLKTRDTSCHCETCLSGKFCSSWASVAYTTNFAWRSAKSGDRRNPMFTILSSMDM